MCIYSMLGLREFRLVLHVVMQGGGTDLYNDIVVTRTTVALTDRGNPVVST